MGKRKYFINKKTDGTIGCLLFVFGAVGLAISATVEFFREIGFITSAIAIVVVVAGITFFSIKVQSSRKAAAEAERSRKISSLLAKYNDRAIVNRIMAGEIWINQTDEQVRDAIGSPEDIDRKVMKNKIREVWKYGQYGTNRYRLRITIENNLVVGWDQK